MSFLNVHKLHCLNILMLSLKTWEICQSCAMNAITDLRIINVVIALVKKNKDYRTTVDYVMHHVNVSGFYIENALCQ